MLLLILLRYVRTIQDSFSAAAKIIPDRASVHSKNGCGGAISVTERSCAAPISKVVSHISDSCSHYTGQLLKLSVAVTSLV